MSRARPSGFAALFRDYRNYAGARLWLALGLMLLGALAEAFGLLMIVPLASIAIGRSSDAVSRQIPWFASLPPDHRFIVAIGLFLAAMGARSLLLYARDLQNVRLQNGYEASLRLRAAATLASRGWAFAGRIGQSGMQSLLLNDVPRAVEGIGYLQQIAVSAAMLSVQLAVTAFLSAWLTAVALGFLAFGGLVSVRWTRRGVQSGMAIVQSMEESAGAGFRLHAGLKAAQAQGTVSAFLEEYRTSLAGTVRQFVQFTRDYSRAQQLASFAAAVVAAVLLIVGIRLLALPFPVLVASLILFARMSGPAQALQLSAQRAAASVPAFAAIEQRLGKLDGEQMTQEARRPLDWRELRLEGVSFEHQPGLGLGPLSLSLKAGEWTGLFGASGAGKTTLVDLVAGLLTPEKGRVLVDEQPLGGETLERWRAGLAYVGQEGAVFNDSVRANLLAEGAADDETTLWKALEAVGLAQRIRTFAGGLDESVGDRGSRLSGGERQRLVLARALLRRPRLLILDEATAALDAESEGKILRQLRDLTPRCAAILVAHRESSLAYCDSIVSIQHRPGRESGD